MEQRKHISNGLKKNIHMWLFFRVVSMYSFITFITVATHGHYVTVPHHNSLAEDVFVPPYRARD